MNQANIVVNTPALPASITEEDEIAFLAYKLRLAEKRINDQEGRIRELEDLAATDSLTGLMNRRAFEKFFDQELARARRYNSPGSFVLVFDIDSFKGINDTHGHQAGDACLKKVAEYLTGRLRTLDGAARLGGDEFAVVLSHTNSAKTVAEIKAALNNLQIEWHGEKIRFGVSVGVSLVQGGETYEAAYEIADKDLYANKRLKKLSR